MANIPNSFTPKVIPERIDDRHSSTEAHAHTAKYSDEGVFTTTLTYKKPEEVAKVEKTAETLSQAAEDELTQRERAKGRTFSSLPATEQQKRITDAASSCMNRDDIEATIVFDRAQDHPLHVHHTFSHNSPLNGTSFVDESGKKRTISHAIASSQDRTVDRVQMLRKVSTPAGESLAYTGRVETRAKAEEQAQWIFQNEQALKPDMRKGVVKVKEATDREPAEYVLTYVVDALLSETVLPNNPEGRERDFIEKEREVLQNLSGQKIVMKDPATGQDVLVELRPILITHPMNWSQSLNEAAPNWLSRESDSIEISEEGFKAIKALGQARIRAATTRAEKEQIRKALSLLDRFHDAHPEEKIIYLAILSEVLDLPLVFHCISSKDRTGIAIAILSAFSQYKELGLFNGSIRGMLADSRFKELFAANLMIGHNIANYGRGAEGSFSGEELTPLFGLELSGNPIIARLMPDRYLKKVSLSWQIYGALWRVVVSITTFALTIIAAVADVLISIPTVDFWSKRKTVLGVADKMSRRDLSHLFSFYKTIPTKVLNKEAVWVQDRSLQKQKERHKLDASTKAIIDDLEALSDEELDLLKEALKIPQRSNLALKQALHQNPHILSLAFRLAQKKTILSRLGEVSQGKGKHSKAIARQIPEKLRSLLASLKEAPLYQFYRGDHNYQVEFIKFLEGETITLPVEGDSLRAIESSLGMDDLDAHAYQQSLEENYTKDANRSFHPSVNGVPIPKNPEPAHLYRDLDTALQRVGVVDARERQRITACSQQAVLGTALTSLTRFFGILEGRDLTYDQDRNPSDRQHLIEIDTRTKTIKAHAFFEFTDLSLGDQTVSRLEVISTINYETGKEEITYHFLPPERPRRRRSVGDLPKRPPLNRDLI